MLYHLTEDDGKTTLCGARSPVEDDGHVEDCHCPICDRVGAILFDTEGEVN